MATLGLSRRDGFEAANRACARCGVLARVIRSRAGTTGGQPTRVTEAVSGPVRNDVRAGGRDTLRSLDS